MGAMLAIREAGLAVPGDISVIGIDGHPFAASFGLTTCAQDPLAQGRLAAERVVAALGWAGRTGHRQHRAVRAEDPHFDGGAGVLSPSGP